MLSKEEGCFSLSNSCRAEEKHRSYRPAGIAEPAKRSLEKRHDIVKRLVLTKDIRAEYVTKRTELMNQIARYQLVHNPLSSSTLLRFYCCLAPHCTNGSTAAAAAFSASVCAGSPCFVLMPASIWAFSRSFSSI